MKRVFLSISFKEKENKRNEIETIKLVVKTFGYSLIVFVDDYRFGSAQEKEMMDCALADIKASDLLIAEVSTKAIGVGLEVGYARALKKEILYLRDVNSTYSKTVGGTVSHQIIYSNLTELNDKLSQWIKIIE